jgi:hypothetical protein
MKAQSQYPVIELRRYTVNERERARFAGYFEAHFTDVFHQLGAFIFGQFFERDNPLGFTWLRGYPDMDARKRVNEAFYGAREAGLLVTLDVANNYPRHPIREDGPYLLWLGIVPDESVADRRLAPLGARAAGRLSENDDLRRAPEWIVLQPTAQSRLRWRP